MVARPAPAPADVWEILGEVPDPEVPALSVVELGIVRDIEIDGDHVVVSVTPTYSGCPAMHEIERALVGALGGHGLTGEVRRVYTPAWTTDWMSDEAREKLRRYGIAPPGPAASEQTLVQLMRRPASVPCPFCGSTETESRSEFGSTACKSLHFCNACHQPFEHFKAI